MKKAIAVLSMALVLMSCDKVDKQPTEKPIKTVHQKPSPTAMYLGSSREVNDLETLP